MATYGSSWRIETLGQALNMLGLKQAGVMVTSLVMRKVLRTDGPQLTRFWDVSAKRSWALATLARSRLHHDHAGVYRRACARRALGQLEGALARGNQHRHTAPAAPARAAQVDAFQRRAAFR